MDSPCCFFSFGWVKKMIPGTFYHVSLWWFKFCDRVMNHNVQGKISLWGTIFGTLAQLHDGEGDGTDTWEAVFLFQGKNENMGYGVFFWRVAIVSTLVLSFQEESNALSEWFWITDVTMLDYGIATQETHQEQHRVFAFHWRAFLQEQQLSCCRLLFAFWFLCVFFIYYGNLALFSPCSLFQPTNRRKLMLRNP